ncbi:hypothetical protein [Streptomyces sp. NPDC096934]|uniref:polysaccharide biosynthesis C-terminal domain-containing protein n=1 Tax=Streptomyces sp. NPDC096934 TaxID=3155551 RepID=UPI00331E95F9
MSDATLVFRGIENSGDARGGSFPIPPQVFAEAFPVRDAHLSTLRPGHTRGDHYHVVRHEILAVLATGAWSLHWDAGPGTPTRHEHFDGTMAVVVEVPPLVAHAIRNDGGEDLQLMGISDLPYDPDHPDTLPRQVSDR